MHPCTVCGSPGVDAAGYCVQCRTYRGQPAIPPASQRKRSVMLIPLVALSATLVVLVVAIVVVVAKRSGPGTNDPTASGRTTASNPAIDSCVIGTWQISAYSEDVPIDGLGTVKFTGQGTQVRLRADGTGVTDYRDATTFTGTASGVTYTLVVSGTVKFDYKAKDGRVSFSNLSASGKETVTRSDTGQQVTQDLTGSADPANYTCTGDKMVEYTNEYRAEMGRLSKTG